MDQPFSSIPRALAPLFAPLPLPMINFLLTMLLQQRKSLDKDRGYTAEQYYLMLYRLVNQARHSIFMVTDPFLRAGRIADEQSSVKWFREVLARQTPGKVGVSQQTLYNWRDHGLLTFEKYGQIEMHRASALLVARIVASRLDATRIRNWHPSSIALEEPVCWCYRQDPPAGDGTPSPILPYPFPPEVSPPAGALPLKKATLLWMHWEGASWERHWQLLDSSLGQRAMRFAGIELRRPEMTTTQWALTVEDLARWDHDLVRRHLPREEHQRAPKKIQCVADLLLRDLIEERISLSDPEPSFHEKKKE